MHDALNTHDLICIIYFRQLKLDLVKLWGWLRVPSLIVL